MDSYSGVPGPLPIAPGIDISAHWMQPYHLGQLVLVKTIDKEPQAIIDLITQWALRDRFYLIAAGEWLPHHDDVRYSVYRYTCLINETLDNLILSRPFTCYQLLDLLIEADQQCKPVLILDYLHLFYDPNVDLSLRDRVLERCCHYVRRLSFLNRVALFVQERSGEEYRRFFPIVASMVDEIVEAEKRPSVIASQIPLF